MEITLHNDFHNSSATLRPTKWVRTKDQLTLTLSPRQVQKAQKTLCGVKDCTCGGLLGERGEQHLGGSYEIEPQPDGSARLIIFSR